MWHFYIVECKDGTLYSGISSDLVRRIIKHNRGKGSIYTRARRPVKLVYWEEFPDKISAAKREREVKDWRRTEKMQLIKSKFPSQEKKDLGVRDKRVLYRPLVPNSPLIYLHSEGLWILSLRVFFTWQSQRLLHPDSSRFAMTGGEGLGLEVQSGISRL